MYPTAPSLLYGTCHHVYGLPDTLGNINLTHQLQNCRRELIQARRLLPLVWHLKQVIVRVTFGTSRRERAVLEVLADVTDGAGRWCGERAVLKRKVQ
jgi:hypothetical protein